MLISKMYTFFKAVAVVVLLSFYPFSAFAEGEFSKEPAVDVFINKMVKSHGFDKKKLEELFDNVQYIERSINLMDRPAESLDWGTYMARVITNLRTADGVKYYKQKRRILLEAQKKYGVPSYIIAGILGVETNFGQIQMRYRAIDALATLAFFYPRRAEYFTGELESLLRFAKKTDTDPLSFVSSYAGAVGIPQFMPSNVSKFAVDGDKDGKIDIIKNHSDAIFSIGNYLNKYGWKKNIPVSLKVKTVGSGFKRFIQTSPCSGKKNTVRTLRKAGVVFPEKVSGNLNAVLFEVDTGKGKSEYHVAFDNFCVITKYNNSVRYVLAVNYLGNKIGRRVGDRQKYK